MAKMKITAGRQQREGTEPSSADIRTLLCLVTPSCPAAQHGGAGVTNSALPHCGHPQGLSPLGTEEKADRGGHFLQVQHKESCAGSLQSLVMLAGRKAGAKSPGLFAHLLVLCFWLCKKAGAAEAGATAGRVGLSIGVQKGSRILQQARAQGKLMFVPI